MIMHRTVSHSLTHSGTADFKQPWHAEHMSLTTVPPLITGDIKTSPPLPHLRRTQLNFPPTTQGPAAGAAATAYHVCWGGCYSLSCLLGRLLQPIMLLLQPNEPNLTSAPLPKVPLLGRLLRALRGLRCRGLSTSRGSLNRTLIWQVSGFGPFFSRAGPFS